MWKDVLPTVAGVALVVIALTAVVAKWEVSAAEAVLAMFGAALVAAPVIAKIKIGSGGAGVGPFPAVINAAAIGARGACFARGSYQNLSRYFARRGEIRSGDLEQSEPSPLPAGLPRPGSPVFLTRHSGRARLKVTYDTLVFLKYF